MTYIILGTVICIIAFCCNPGIVIWALIFIGGIWASDISEVSSEKDSKISPLLENKYIFPFFFITEYPFTKGKQESVQAPAASAEAPSRASKAYLQT